MGLSVREILILDYFDGKPVHAKMPSYLYATYGSDADLCLTASMLTAGSAKALPGNGEYASR